MTDKVILNHLANLQNDTTATNTLNANADATTVAINNTLSRDGTTPNQMSASIDMNSNRILNLPLPITSLEPLRLTDVNLINGGGTINISPLPIGGTTGQLLAKNSNTNYDTVWTSPVSFNFSPQGRLTLTSGVAITTNDVVGATLVYYTPSSGNLISVNGSSVSFTEIFNNTTQSSVGNAGPAATVANSVYDLYFWVSGGTNYLTRSPAWATDISRGTGAGTAEIQVTNGLITNKWAITNGPAAGLGTLVGSIRTDGLAQTKDTKAFRWVSNAYNAVPRQMLVTEPTGSWTYTTGAFRQVNGNAANQLDFVQTLSGSQVTVDVLSAYSNTTVSTFAVVGIDIDTLNTTTLINNINTVTYVPVANMVTAAQAKYNGYPGLGRHTAIWKEFSQPAGTGTFFGNGSGIIFQTGIYGSVSN